MNTRIFALAASALLLSLPSHACPGTQGGCPAKKAGTPCAMHQKHMQKKSMSREDMQKKHAEMKAKMQQKRAAIQQKIKESYQRSHPTFDRAHFQQHMQEIQKKMQQKRAQMQQKMQQQRAKMQQKQSEAHAKMQATQPQRPQANTAPAMPCHIKRPPQISAPAPKAPASSPCQKAASKPVADHDKDGIVDARDMCPATPAGTRVDSLGCGTSENISLQGVQFKLGSDELKTESVSILDRVARSLAKRPDIKLEIAGHTDAQGDAATNLDLSQRRANQVKQYLVGKGLKADNFTAKGYGETQLLSQGDSKADHAKNRRVELRPLNATQAPTSSDAANAAGSATNTQPPAPQITTPKIEVLPPDSQKYQPVPAHTESAKPATIAPDTPEAEAEAQAETQAEQKAKVPAKPAHTPNTKADTPPEASTETQNQASKPPAAAKAAEGPVFAKARKEIGEGDTQAVKDADIKLDTSVLK